MPRPIKATKNVNITIIKPPSCSFDTCFGDLTKENSIIDAPARFGSASRGKTGIVYVPADLVKDTTCPFAEGDSLLIRIDGERIIIEKSKKRKD